MELVQVQDFLGQNHHVINDEAVSAVDPILPKPLSEIPRSEVLLPYILPQNRPHPKSS